MVNVECFPFKTKNKVRMSTDIISCQVCEEGSSAIRKEVLSFDQVSSFDQFSADG